MTDPVPVRVRDCACPHTPHPDGDVVTIRPALSLAGGLAAEQQMLEVFGQAPLPDGASDAQKDAVGARRALLLRPVWFETFIRHGALGWNLTDEDGEPVPFDPEALLSDYGLARPVGDACADRYSESVLAPFQTPPAKHSRSGPTAGGTSRPVTRTRSR